MSNLGKSLQKLMGSDPEEEVSVKVVTYHYTSWECWQQIKKEGLKPYKIEHPSIKQYYPRGVWGIWLWKNDTRGMAHLGSIIFQIGAKGSARIVRLMVKAPLNGRLMYGEREVSLTHNGTIGAWAYGNKKNEMKNEVAYHEDEVSFICTRAIPPGDVELVGDYDMLKLVGG